MPKHAERAAAANPAPILSTAPPTPMVMPPSFPTSILICCVVVVVEVVVMVEFVDIVVDADTESFGKK